MSDFKKKFEKEIVAKLQEKLGVKNPMAVPRLRKIVVNMSSREFLGDKKILEAARQDLSLITGQKPKVARARTAVAAFKLREGDQIGLVVSLRGKRMYDFFEKLVKIVFPRVRDFSGVRRQSLDERGNISLGFSEYTIFPEIDPGKIDKIRGFEITIVTNAKDRHMAEVLFEEMGIPFRKGATSI